MAENGTNIPSPAKAQDRRPTSFPKLFTGFATLKAFSDEAVIMSPTSILDGISFAGIKNSFWSDSGTPKTPESVTRHKLGSRIALGIVDALRDDDFCLNPSKPDARMVLFGSQLRIQIPPLSPSPVGSPKSPPEFGIKTRNSKIGSVSSSPVRKSGFGSANSGMDVANSPRVFTGSLSATEMELSEDYTCVISHEPIPKTTHIFDDCVVGSCYGVVGFASPTKINGFPGNRSCFQSENFLSSCYACKKNLDQGKDTFMYRGEKAFCSQECRYEEMVLEDGMD